RARAARVLVDDHDQLRRPAERERALAERVLTRSRLKIVRHLRERRLTHIHDRPPPPLLLRNLRQLTHRARPPKAAPQAAPASTSPAPPPPPAASPTPPPVPPPARPSRARTVPTCAPPFSAEARRRRGRRDRSPSPRASST